MSSTCGAQIVLKGSVKDLKGNSIVNGYVISKGVSVSDNIVEYTAISSGQYEFHINSVYNDSIFIETRVAGYHDVQIGFKFEDILSRTKLYNFVLNVKADSLDQIIIKRDLPKRVIIKQDTISYDVSQISDIEDRKLKDILNKIPNLDFNESTGVIKYKDILIKTITINGNNIIDANYALIAKNLNLNMIDRLEAIDNYSDNPIISKYSSSEDKSLNVVLKKNAYQLTTGLEGIAGLFDRNYVGAAVAITPSVFNEKLNSLNYLGANNISINPSSIEINDIASSYENLNTSNTISPLFSSRFTSANILGNNRSLINDTGYLSANATYQLSKGVSLKLNLDYLEDNHEIERTDKILFNVDDFIENTLNAQTSYRPQFSSLRLEYRKLTSKDLLEIKSSVQKNESARNSRLLRNNQEEFLLDENQRLDSFATSLEYSKKINDANAIQISVETVIQKNTLNFIAEPSLLSTNISQLNDSQDHEINKITLGINAIHYLKLGNSKLVSSIGAENRVEEFNSFLNLADNINQNNNEVALENLDLSFNNSYNFRMGKFKFSALSTLIYIGQQLEQENILNKRSFHFLPRARIKYDLNSSYFIFDASRTLTRLKLENTFTQNYITSENSIIANSPTLDFIVGTNLRLGFYKSGEKILFKNFNTSIGYARTNGLYLSRIEANEAIIRSNNFFSRGVTENFQINTTFSRYWGETKLRLEISPYLIYSVQPIALNSNFSNDVTSLLSGTSLILKSTLLSWLRFGYESDLRFNSSVIENKNLEFASINQNVSFRVKPLDNLWFKLIYDVHIPDIKRTDAFAFLDAEVSFDIIPKVRTFLIGKNLLNIEGLETNSIDAISRVTSVQNVQSRYLGLRFEFDLL